MATIKVVLRKKANKDGTFPLALRITKDRKTSFIHLGYHLKENEWNESDQMVKSSHPNSKRLNHFILVKKAEASDKIIDIETHKDSVTVKAIKSKIRPKAGGTFFSQAKLHLDKNKGNGSYNEFLANSSRLNIFRGFVGGNDIAFSDITTGLLDKYKIYLKSIRNNSERTIANHLMLIRTIFNQAIKDSVIDAKYYPFGEEKVTITVPQSTKVGLSADDVYKLENVKLLNPSHDHVRNLWLTSFYFAGMRISDVLRLKWSDFQNLRLHYTMGKNNKPGSVKILDKAWAIIEKYQNQKLSPDDFVFPDLKGVNAKDQLAVKHRIRLCVDRTNRMLHLVALTAQLEGKLTTHVARHTFATLAGENVPLQMLQKLYRHSDVRTTIGYQSNFIYKDADDALQAVIGK